MVTLRSFFLLLSLCFFSGDAFNVSHFKEFPLWLVEGPCYKGQYWSFKAEYCPGSSEDWSELYQYYMMMIFTNTSTNPQKIEGTTMWYYDYSAQDGNGRKGSLAENNRCGRCNTFGLCRDTGYYKTDFKHFTRAMELYKANQLGVEFFIWIARNSGTTGDNEINYYPHPYYFKEYEDKGTRKRYRSVKNKQNEGAIRYKRIKVIGFAPVNKKEGMEIPDDSEYVLADVVNDCDKLDPKTYLPGHGMYRMMVEGEPRGKKGSFWWKSQYYYPVPGDYFT